MWNRAELKQRAKSVLKGSYWKAFLVSLILGIATGAGSGGSVGSSNPNKSNRSFNGGNFDKFDFTLLMIILSIAIIVIIISILFRIFLGFQLEVGARKYFIQASNEDVNLDHLGFAFRNGRYFKVVKVMFICKLYLLFWTLLLFVPGIIKSYSYYLVPYIISDNPDLTPREAITLSRKLANGYKLKMFIMDLSFLGWFFLGLFLCVFGVFFVYLPYFNTTYAEVYLWLKNNNNNKEDSTVDNSVIL